MRPDNQQRAFDLALSEARKAITRGERLEARRWAQKAANLAPHREEPWLILAAVASPRASVAYLQRVLEINPESGHARKGMHWAVTRLRKSGLHLAPRPRKILVEPSTLEDQIRPRSVFIPWAAALLFIILAALFWATTPTLSRAFEGQRDMALALVNLEKPTFTPTPTATFTPSPTATPTNTPTATPTDTPTPTATFTPSPTPTDPPTATPTDPPTATPFVVNVPADVGKNEHWIDVDLTNQITRAYKGDQLVRTFVVSTGTWRTPTVTGQYRVYVKYEFADMSGPGYYLANVPYVMYFYQGYGLHGTYWHNNFGTPMSHGCINLTIDDAGWLFAFSSVGTLVNIHY